jgi:hypothetical protein
MALKPPPMAVVVYFSSLFLLTSTYICSNFVTGIQYPRRPKSGFSQNPGFIGPVCFGSPDPKCGGDLGFAFGLHCSLWVSPLFAIVCFGSPDPKLFCDRRSHSARSSTGYPAKTFAKRKTSEFSKNSEVCTMPKVRFGSPDPRSHSALGHLQDASQRPRRTVDPAGRVGGRFENHSHMHALLPPYRDHNLPVKQPFSGNSLDEHSELLDHRMRMPRGK